jgi:hypothetical protein
VYTSVDDENFLVFKKNARRTDYASPSKKNLTKNGSVSQLSEEKQTLDADFNPNNSTP